MVAGQSSSYDANTKIRPKLAGQWGMPTRNSTQPGWCRLQPRLTFQSVIPGIVDFRLWGKYNLTNVANVDRQRNFLASAGC